MSGSVAINENEIRMAATSSQVNVFNPYFINMKENPHIKLNTIEKILTGNKKDKEKWDKAYQESLDDFKIQQEEKLKEVQINGLFNELKKDFTIEKLSESLFQGRPNQDEKDFLRFSIGLIDYYIAFCAGYMIITNIIARKLDEKIKEVN